MSIQSGRFACFSWLATSSLLMNLGCGYRELPPPSAPSADVPRVDMPTNRPAPGTRRVVLDGNGEPAMTEDLLTSRLVRNYDAAGADESIPVASANTNKLCITPCVVDMTLGPHLVYFASTRDDARASWAKFRVDQNDLVVRHAIGHTESRTFAQRAALVPTLLGGTFLLGGIVIAGAGASTDDRNEGITTTNGFIAMGIGAGLLAIGIPLALMTRPYHQSGTTTALVLPPPPPPPPAAPSLTGAPSAAPPSPPAPAATP